MKALKNQLDSSPPQQNRPFEPFCRPAAGSYSLKYVPGGGGRAALQPRQTDSKSSIFLGRGAVQSVLKYFLLLSSCSLLTAEERTVFDDLQLLESINKKIADELPFFYNSSLVGGYFNMPSARMAKCGTAALGVAAAPPYTIYGVNFQMFDHIEMSGNYRIFNGIIEKNFGHEGFGDDADRVGNFKISLLLPEDGYPMLPSIAVGAEDFAGTRRFHSKYVVVTKSWLKANLEVTLGWGKGRIKGLFGGATWSPFRQTGWRYLNGLALSAEYDAINYKKHEHEHPRGREVKTRFNAGLNYLLWDSLQFSISSLRGEKVAGSASYRYPLGTASGIMPKIKDPAVYSSPVDTEPLGVLRPEKELAQELAYALSDQGLDLYSAYLFYDAAGKKCLWLKIVNNRYREEKIVRDRLEHVLAALTPSDVASVTVVIEADALACHTYRYRTEDLRRFSAGVTGRFELETLAPMREAISRPSDYDSSLIFRRRKSIWAFSLYPQLLTFFGSSKGKFKYAVGPTAAIDGYLFDEVYYRLQAAYWISSSIVKLGQQDKLNPSRLLNVRTDSVRYFQTNTVTLEQAYLQKGWNLGRGWFYRFAGGYFEPAYGGLATEFLFFPVNSCWAVGADVATLLKRRYQGIAFTQKVRKFRHGHVEHLGYFGLQYFLNLHYMYKPLDLEFLVKAGQFLAKDLGARFEATRYFKSGLKFSIWYTVTNGHDKINGKTYFDKGFVFSIPFDMFLKQSSRDYINYGMSVWLRDVGAIADTGRTLYYTLNEERYNY